MPVMRAGSRDSLSLLTSTDGTVWKYELSRYGLAIQHVADQKKKKELIALDKWLWKEYPLAVKSRDTPHITADELSEVMKWKLLRGKFRPALQSLVRENPESTVIKVSTVAITSLNCGDWKEALKKMTELRGVGPATASALLAPLFSSVPFMADEVLEAATGRPREYTLKAYEEMRDVIVKISDSNGVGSAMTAEDVGKALWTRAMLGPDSNSLQTPLVLEKSLKDNRASKRKECGLDDSTENGKGKKRRM